MDRGASMIYRTSTSDSFPVYYIMLCASLLNLIWQLLNVTKSEVESSH